MDISNQAVTQISNAPEGACQPAWSPDGSRLVFISPCKGMDEIYYGSGLYLVNADGSGEAPLPTIPGGGDFDPAWSPDGKTIAFTSLRTGQMEIYLFNVEDQSVKQITKGAADVESRQPAFSPDGSQIAYTVKRLGVYQLWLMNSDGAGQKQIVRSGTGFSDYLPVWSLDGQVILFNQRCAGASSCQPYLMRISAIDRSSEQGTRLQVNVVTVQDTQYSPDGFWLVYEGEESVGNNDIFFMAITGSGKTRLTTAPGLDFDPTWRPVSDIPALQKP